MPISYKCDNCEVTATTLDGWLIVSVSLLHDVANAPPPGGRTLDQTLPDLLYHDQACLTAWRTKAGI